MAAGPDLISNIHLKHLGPIALNALTDLFKHSWTYDKIPQVWKKAIIIPILKPGKPPNMPASYRPISLLCTASKIMERLILQNISPFVPLSPSQHGFRPLHSTTTHLSTLTQLILDGFNQRQPPLRTVLAAIDIHKAFDTVPRHILTDKILQTDMHTNDKKWLTNFISGRQAKSTSPPTPHPTDTSATVFPKVQSYPPHSSISSSMTSPHHHPLSPSSPTPTTWPLPRSTHVLPKLPTPFNLTSTPLSPG